MARKAPRLLALLVSSVWFLAGRAEGAAYRRHRLPGDGQTVTGVVRVSGFVLDFRTRSTGSRCWSAAASHQPGRHEHAAPRRPRDLPELRQQRHAESRVPLLVPGARHLQRRPARVSIRVTEAVTGRQTIGHPERRSWTTRSTRRPSATSTSRTPPGLEGANGSFPVVGWALDDVDMDHIDFLVDGQIVAGAVGRGVPGTAVFGTTRPDVVAAFPDFLAARRSTPASSPTSTRPSSSTDCTFCRSGRPTTKGRRGTFGSRTVQIINNGSNLAPFGRIDTPLDKASLFCTPQIVISPGPCPSPCFPGGLGGGDIPASPDRTRRGLGARRRAPRSTAARCPTSSSSSTGRSSPTRRTDCVAVGQTLTNCYGINRPDVATQLPGLRQRRQRRVPLPLRAFRPTPMSGSCHIFDPAAHRPRRSPAAHVPGKHTLAIRVGDEEETVAQIAAMSVDILCDISFGESAGLPSATSTRPATISSSTASSWCPAGRTTSTAACPELELDVDGQVVATTAIYGDLRHPP